MENNKKIDEEKLKKVTEISQRDAQHYFHFQRHTLPFLCQPPFSKITPF